MAEDVGRCHDVASGLLHATVAPQLGRYGRVVELVERSVETSEGPVRYIAAGAGRGVVLLHGGAQWADLWHHEAGLVGRLARDFRVVAIDRPGHGPRSLAVPADAHREESVVSRVVSVLDVEDIDRASVWGYSLGARTALSLAVLHPSRVTALVQMSPPPLDEERFRRFYTTVAALADSHGLRDVLRTLGVEGGSVVDAAVEHVGDVTWRDAVLGAMSFHPDPSAVSVPWLYAFGSRERPEPAADDLRAVTDAGGEVQVIEGADHVGMFDRTEEVLEAALSLFDQIS